MSNAQTKKREAKFYDFVLNKRLRELIKHRVDIDKFATNIGVSVKAVRQWTSGYSRPDMDKIVIIAHSLGVTTDYLLGASDRESVSFTNYLDAARIMLDFMDSGIASLSIRRFSDGTAYGVSFSFSSYSFVTFFSEYYRMAQLFKDGAITYNIYSSWISSEFQKLQNEALPFTLSLDEISQKFGSDKVALLQEKGIIVFQHDALESNNKEKE